MPDPRVPPNMVPLRFPAKGVDVNCTLDRQPEGTTPLAQNVRLQDQLGRDRGASRPGLAKYVAGQVDGNHPVQCMASVVTCSGEALGFVFGGDTFESDGLDDFGPGGFSALPEGPVGGGGGGYQPSVSFQERRPKINMTADAVTQPADGSQATVFATATDRLTGSPYGALTIVLHTSPAGRVGDGDAATTSLVNGVAAFFVSDTTEELVTYTATATAGGFGVKDSEDSVAIAYSGNFVLTLAVVSSGAVPGGSGIPDGHGGFLDEKFSVLRGSITPTGFASAVSLISDDTLYGVSVGSLSVTLATGVTDTFQANWVDGGGAIDPTIPPYRDYTISFGGFTSNTVRVTFS